ncbi:MAG: Txe/YoeB family addiction module toxin [Treponema sp.]|jgi:Txe/YoeB family toxin of toxin-antitoxin system|nr:Txe/YoeB family addiction module toxin [Treponema sp.]
MYRVVYSSQARKAAKKIAMAGLRDNVQKLIGVLHNNPYQNHPPYEKLLGDLLGSYSKRINIQHRFYQYASFFRVFYNLPAPGPRGGRGP